MYNYYKGMGGKGYEMYDFKKLWLTPIHPEGRLGMSGDIHCLECQGCRVISLFLILSPHIFFCLVLLLFPSCPFSADGHFLDFSFFSIIHQEIVIFVFCKALVEQLEDN